MKKDCEIVDLFLYEYIRSKQRKEARKCSSSSMEEEEAQLDLLMAFMKEKEKNNQVEEHHNFWPHMVKKLIYLHAAMCEPLRLFPPVAFGQRQAIHTNTLPSGHCVNPSSMIIYSMYTIGRSKEIWGENCLEFKQERWTSSKGEITHVPSYKFITFNAGPRSCLEKEMSFNEMKMVASAVLRNYHIQLVKGHRASPTLSIGISMKQGLKVKITKRSI
ncbi:hypothetical protein L6164_023141 [Bauhinia variegata]|uniref:Uncharacterized protein n=1 Tax=Bauhinia variegata TaxID=167791 RepID=A0ACB9MJ88_BAUVA|nr:hypothetical protein L6164_023141 [Bauhinia variegata]